MPHTMNLHQNDINVAFPWVTDTPFHPGHVKTTNRKFFVIS